MISHQDSSDLGYPEIRRIQTIVHSFLRGIVREGDWVIDATAGRGRDTLLLARCIGTAGKVFAFDVQEEAIGDTEKLLQAHDLLDRVALNHLDHARLGEVVNQQVRAVVFNLGYLPGSNHSVTTQPESTLRAIRQALPLLSAGGALILTVYRGHAGALAEAIQVDQFLTTLPKQEFTVLKGDYLNQGADAPYWIIVQRAGREKA